MPYSWKDNVMYTIGFLSEVFTVCYSRPANLHCTALFLRYKLDKSYNSLCSSVNLIPTRYYGALILTIVEMMQYSQ